jgi:wee1-like protein kinase
MANALSVIHAKGLVHLDLKPDNIYVLNGVYKLGDFGRATRADGSMDIEEGDSRYMPLEMLKEDYSELSKVDMFALGATIYELARGSPLLTSGSQFHTLRQGKLTLLPGSSLSFQTIIKVRPLCHLLYIDYF